MLASMQKLMHVYMHVRARTCACLPCTQMGIFTVQFEAMHLHFAASVQHRHTMQYIVHMPAQ